MTGQEIQSRLDAIVQDLQTDYKGMSVGIALRDDTKGLSIFPLTSDGNGVINASQLATISGFLSDVKASADAYDVEYAPVSAASETYRNSLAPHQALATAATQARADYNDALDADTAVQTAKANYLAAKSDPDYVTARANYKLWNASENYNNLSDARGKYSY